MNIVFLNIDPDTWIAYLDNQPSVNFQAGCIKEALKGLLEMVKLMEQNQPYRVRRISKYNLRLERAELPF